MFSYDIDSGAWQSTVINGLAPGATLPTATGDGQYVVVTTRNGDAVQFLDSGMRLVADPHGSTVVRGPPAMEDAAFSSDAPGHVESRYGWIVVFFDGSLGVPRNSPSHVV